MKFLLGAMAVAGVLSMAWVQRASGEELTHTKDSLDTVKQNLKDGKAVLVDVREQKEWDEGHLAGAVLLPKSKLEVEVTIGVQRPELVDLQKIKSSLPIGKISAKATTTVPEITRR